MKKVLFISYAFPPAGGIGVQRITKFIKNLAKLGWEITVLTSDHNVVGYNDLSLLAEIPASVHVQRVGYIEPMNWVNNHWYKSLWRYLLYPLFLFPDRQILWFNPALKKAAEIIQQEKINLVFTSSGPLTNHFIACALKKSCNIKWVADWRDEWATNPGLHFPTPFRRVRAKIWEKRLIMNADHITTVSEPLTEYFQSLSSNKNKFTTITNGYDPADFSPTEYHPTEFFHLVHVGTLYGKSKINALDEAIKELNLVKLKVEYVGDKNYLPHQEAVRKMQQADVLLLVLASTPRPGVYSGKIFEYLAAGRPILALVPEGTMAGKLISQFRVGEIVTPQDKEGIKNAITKFYQAWENHRLSVPAVNIDPYNRQHLTKKLATIFDQLTLNHHQ